MRDRVLESDMPKRPSTQAPLWIGGGILIAVVALLLGLIASTYRTIRQSHQDYDEVKACLEQHQFRLEDSWQHEDLYLEDFGWLFRLPDGTKLGIEVYDGNKTRDCDDLAQGIQLIFNHSSNGGNYLPFDHPALVEALDGEHIRTMDDLLDHLDWLAEWAQTHPEALMPQSEIRDHDRYINLLVFPGDQEDIGE